MEGTATPEQLQALADFVKEEKKRQEAWRHTAGLDSNWHGQIIPELEDHL